MAARMLAAAFAVAALPIGLLPFGVRPAAATGVVAIGIPDNVAKSGVAFGFRVRASSASDAERDALDQCRKSANPTSSSSSDYARSLCKIVATFNGACIAVSMDPKDGTPGFGWSIASDKETAEGGAMQQCASTAGRDRRRFCKLFHSECDR